MKAKAVIGSLWGDEGKGLMVDFLCRHCDNEPIVVRYNGGAQAGHTVVTSAGKRHVFHHYGSGCFVKAPTFLAREFIVNPSMWEAEYTELQALGLNPKLYVYPGCAVTTVYDMYINQKLEESRTNRHGSCGMGIHETMLRHPIIPLRVMDITRNNFDKYLERVRDYTIHRLQDLKLDTEENISWIKNENVFNRSLSSCKEFLSKVELMSTFYLTKKKDIIFEGAQGLLLDSENKQYFPHVTHSRTGLPNIMQIANQIGIEEIDVVYVARSYMTRHGAGHLPGEDFSLSFADDTNKHNDWQHSLRFAKQSNQVLSEAIHNDLKSNQIPYININPALAITHLDQMLFKANVEGVPTRYESFSPTANGVWKIPQSAAMNALKNKGPARVA